MSASAQTRPLAGVRVLDLSRLIPGPYCTLILADLGAEVTKVEDTGAGDYLRQMPPQREGLGGMFYALNRGKRSIAIDLKQPAGRTLFLERLLPDHRVVVESFRPGVMDRLGLSFETLRGARPDVVLCSISGYGQDGPLRDRAGHDINYVALSGVLAALGGQVPGVQIADIVGGGLWAAVRILAALLGPRAAHLDVSMTEGALSLLVPWLGARAFGGAPLRHGRGVLGGELPSYNVYRTADDRQLAVGALEPKFQQALRAALGVDPTSGEALSRQLFTRDRDDWSDALAPADACVEPVLELDELSGHPQHQARAQFFALEDPARGSLELPRLPLGAASSSPAPTQGQHTDEILREAGLDAKQVAALRAAATVR